MIRFIGQTAFLALNVYLLNACSAQPLPPPTFGDHAKDIAMYRERAHSISLETGSFQSREAAQRAMDFLAMADQTSDPNERQEHLLEAYRRLHDESP